MVLRFAVLELIRLWFCTFGLTQNLLKVRLTLFVAFLEPKRATRGKELNLVDFDHKFQAREFMVKVH